MTENKERRATPRIQRPFEGSWSGASGATRCRIGDISLGGCFVESLAAPKVGEPTTVTITFGAEHAMTFSGHVIYVDDPMGFAVKFNELSGADRALFVQFLESMQK